jgi:hypothetical protein
MMRHLSGLVLQCGVDVIMPFHSLRTGGAMVVKLAGEEDNTIQLDGRWSHDTLILDMHSRIEL